MVIIFGTRAYFRSNKVSQYGFCNHCDQFAKFSSFDAMRFFHLYYIPLIPTQGSRRNHKMCPKCNVVQLFEPNVFGEIITSLKDQTADAIVALQSGDTTFTDDKPDAEPIECVPFLHSVLDWLYAANNVEFCNSILSQLDSPNCRFARSILEAALETMRGNLDKAILAYKDAASVDPASPQPHQLMGHLLIQRNRREEAIDSYKSALALTSDPQIQLGLNIQLADQEMTAKRFADAAASYERAVQIRPELASHAPFAKALKKAKKKAGI
jgi:hypothetical protein